MSEYPKDAFVCPICRLEVFTPFFDLTNVPTQDGVLWNTRDEALKAPTGNIQLAFCHNCGYIGNLSFDIQKIKYDLDYSFSLHFSPTYQEFIKNLSVRLIDVYGIRSKKVLEIGCGQGDFLREICHRGENNGIGIDPSIEARVEALGANQITFYADLYTEKYANLDCDLICCRQVLDQLADPRMFLEIVRNNMGSNDRIIVYFEVPNATNIFEDMLIRNIIYEKSSWFTKTSLKNLFELSGFRILSVEPCFEDGQYLGIEAVPSLEIMPEIMAYVDQEGFEKCIEAFSENHQRKILDWGKKLDSLIKAGKRTIVWGAGSGAINFLSMLNVIDQVPYVVDINPRRQGKYLPITGQEVVRPAFILEYGADTVIITNSTYETEIKKQVSSMGFACDFWTI